MCRPTRVNANNSGGNNNNNNNNNGARERDGAQQAARPDEAAPSPPPPAAASGLRRSRPSASALVVLASPPPVLPSDLTSTEVILPDNSTAVSFSIQVQFRTVPGRWQMSDEEMGDIWYTEEGAAPEQTFREESRDTIKIIRRNGGDVDALDPTTHTVRGIEHLLTLEALTRLNQEKTASVRSVLDAVGSTIAAPFSDELRKISMDVTREAVDRARQRGLQDEADAHALFHHPLAPRNRLPGANASASASRIPAQHGGSPDPIVQDALTLAATTAAATPTTTTSTMPSPLPPPPAADSPLHAAAAAAVQAPQQGAAGASSSADDVLVRSSSSLGSESSAESSEKDLVSIEAAAAAGMQLPSISSISLGCDDGEPPNT